MSQVRLLIIDDDDDLRSIITRWLDKSGYDSLTAADGLQGLRLFHEQHPDLVVLDINMPGMDGWTVAERMREISEVPLIMLTARTDKEDRLRGFTLGVDDYVIKPFIPEELVARIGAILKRSNRATAPSADVLTCGDIMIDLSARRVIRAGQALHLSSTEFRLLAALAEQPGIPIAPSALLKAVWGDVGYREEDNLRTYIRYLREKLEVDPKEPRIIINERGFGYFLNRRVSPPVPPCGVPLSVWL